MTRIFALLIALVLAVGGPALAQDQRRSDQGEARKEIEQRVLPQMRGSEYLGPSYDSTARAYRLKFIRDGRVSFVDVDARTGRIISRSR